MIEEPRDLNVIIQFTHAANFPAKNVNTYIYSYLLLFDKTNITLINKTTIPINSCSLICLILENKLLNSTNILFIYANMELYIMSRLTNTLKFKLKFVKNMEIDSKALLVSCKATASRLCCSFTI